MVYVEMDYTDQCDFKVLSQKLNELEGNKLTEKEIEWIKDRVLDLCSSIHDEVESEAYSIGYDDGCERCNYEKE
jgi:hypothetical protein